MTTYETVYFTSVKDFPKLTYAQIKYICCKCGGKYVSSARPIIDCGFVFNTKEAAQEAIKECQELEVTQ